MRRPEHVPPGVPRQDTGFVLLDALVSLVLASIIIFFIAEAARRGAVVLQRADESVETVETIRSVEGLLDRLLASAYPADITLDDKSIVPVFDGAADRVTFATVPPPALGKGGYYRILLARRGDELVIGSVPERGWPVALADVKLRAVLKGLEALRIQYFGARAGGLPQWHDEWRHSDRLPTVVAIHAKWMHAGLPQEMAIQVRTHIDVNGQCAYDVRTGRCRGT